MSWHAFSHLAFFDTCHRKRQRQPPPFNLASRSNRDSAAIATVHPHPGSISLSILASHHRCRTRTSSLQAVSATHPRSVDDLPFSETHAHRTSAWLLVRGHLGVDSGIYPLDACSICLHSNPIALGYPSTHFGDSCSRPTRPSSLYIRVLLVVAAFPCAHLLNTPPDAPTRSTSLIVTDPSSALISSRSSIEPRASHSISDKGRHRPSSPAVVVSRFSPSNHGRCLTVLKASTAPCTSIATPSPRYPCLCAWSTTTLSNRLRPLVYLSLHLPLPGQ